MFLRFYIWLSTILVVNVYSAAIEPCDHAISTDLSYLNQHQFERADQEAIREKRSQDLLGLLKSKISQGIKSKVSKIASSSAYLSGGSSGKHYPTYEHYDSPHPYEPSFDEVKTFDFWDLQKSILNTLLQAAKAIKGGLLALKGHIVKGSGYLVSAKGKLISAKGEAITHLGKQLASSALLSPRPHHHVPSEHAEIEYGALPSSVGHEDYHSFTDDSSSYGAPHTGYIDHAPSLQELKNHLPRGLNGILVLQKIPKGLQEVEHGNSGAFSIPDPHLFNTYHETPKHGLFEGVKHILTSSSSDAHAHKEVLQHYNELPILYHDKSHLHSEIFNQGNKLPIIYHEKPHEHKDFLVSHNQVPLLHLTDAPLPPILPAPVNENIYDKPQYEALQSPLKDLNLIQAQVINSDIPIDSGKLKPPATTYGIPFENPLPETPVNIQISLPPNVPQIPTKLEAYEPLGLPSTNSQPLKVNFVPPEVDSSPTAPSHLPQLDHSKPDSIELPENYLPYSYSSSYANSYANKNINSQADSLLKYFSKHRKLPDLEVSASDHRPAQHRKPPPNRNRNKRPFNKHKTHPRPSRYAPNYRKSLGRTRYTKSPKRLHQTSLTITTH